ncbi:hypothetical protein GBF35_26070 [Nonomuraea phyllanthi]|uniref:hypothetical protein n=1 Tax=Nonomuraea phyllanthi TaxID=2219224 RepID=UPI00129382C9|nr:hypothetical protein [Nonomuraea phyllanthi]QFY09662.1 hypothetical protein GBF35_26070 [Nonomuraea phyllanthi]
MTRAKPPTSDLARLHSLYDRIAEQGLCTRPGADPNHWFPEREPGRNAETQRRFYEQAAAARCFDCPAKTACRVTAEIEESELLLEHGYTPHGIRAGLAPWVRLDLLIASNKASNVEEEAA